MPVTTRRTLFLAVIGIALIALGVVALVVLRGLADESEYSAVPVPVEYAAPALALTDLQGLPVSLEDYRGQVVLVNLWATWCPPCKAEMPVLQAYYEDYVAQGFVIVSIDDGEGATVVQDFVREYGLTFPIWLDEEFQTEKAFRTISLPSSWLVDRQGAVRMAWVGPISRRNLDKYVTPVIRE